MPSRPYACLLVPVSSTSCRHGRRARRSLRRGARCVLLFAYFRSGAERWGAEAVLGAAVVVPSPLLPVRPRSVYWRHAPALSTARTTVIFAVAVELCASYSGSMPFPCLARSRSTRKRVAAAVAWCAAMLCGGSVLAKV